MNTITITIPYNQISGTTSETKYRIKPHCNGVDYYTIEELSEMVNISVRQLERYVAKIKINEKELYRYMMMINNTRYITPGLLILNRNYQKKVNNQEYSRWLSTFSWNHAICIGAKNLSQKKAVHHMEQFCEQLQKRFPDKRINLFYSTEKYPGTNNYHIHFLLSIESVHDAKKIIKFARESVPLSGGDVWESKFDHQKCYVDYVVKHIHSEQDGYGYFNHNG